MATRLGVDVGGTFSDSILYDAATGNVAVGKLLSTPSALERGVLDVLAVTAAPEQISTAQFFFHGTTVGLNALLEGSGPVVGLLATRGFRDVLEVRRGDRVAVYDPTWKPQSPLVPRFLRIGITERTLADGDIAVPLDPEDVTRAFHTLREAEVESIAIAFINAYANPDHELLAADILRDAGFSGDLSLSHDISGEFREYERTSTTVIDAYVRPRVSKYLNDLTTGLGDRGFHGTRLVTRSGGGCLTFEEAQRRPFETVLSGPVAGVVGAAELCTRLKIEMAITADVGGTSFDTCLVVDGRPQLRHEGEIAGMPVQTSWVDVRSIGAGGGSVAYVEGGRLLQVGPHSAGANPGPACYGLGGGRPTVTDAAVVLGMIPQSTLAGGIRLDADAAAQAIANLAVDLSLSPTETASGVVRIVTSMMAEAIRSITLEQGHDPREAVLVPFGGAGPLFATMLARELDIARIAVPANPGIFSAWGLLNQDLAQSAAVTSVRPLDRSSLTAANSLLQNLREELRRRSDTQLDDLTVIDEASFDLRYQGQEYSLNIPVALNVDTGEIASTLPALVEAFTAAYRVTFGHSLDESIEIVTVRATSRRLLPAIDWTDGAADASSAARSVGTTDAFSFTRNCMMPFAVLSRADVSAANWIPGPAIMPEATATIYIDAGYAAQLESLDCLIIERTEDSGK